MTIGSLRFCLFFSLAVSALVVTMLPLMRANEAFARQLAPASFDTPAGKALVEELHAGGRVLFFRHADTIGEPCDRSFKVGDREGQRNISARGREQSRSIGRTIRGLGIPYSRPVLAGPVYRARDTAELAFGAAEVEVTDSLLADDFSGPRLQWVLSEHRRLFSESVPARTNRILVGHRTPAIMVLGASVGDRAFPEGAALVIEPRGPNKDPRVLGILMLAPIEGGGFHRC